MNKNNNTLSIQRNHRESFEIYQNNKEIYLIQIKYFKLRKGCKMRIIKRDKNEEEIAEIFGIYWDEERNQTLFLGMTDKYSGVYVYSESEVEIIDPNINFRTIYLSGHLPGIFHWALIEKDLLDEVIDGNLELRKKFLDILRSENVIDW